MPRIPNREERLTFYHNDLDIAVSPEDYLSYLSFMSKAQSKEPKDICISDWEALSLEGQLVVIHQLALEGSRTLKRVCNFVRKEDRGIFLLKLKFPFLAKLWKEQDENT